MGKLAAKTVGGSPGTGNHAISDAMHVGTSSYTAVGR